MVAYIPDCSYLENEGSLGYPTDVPYDHLIHSIQYVTL